MRSMTFASDCGSSFSAMHEMMHERAANPFIVRCDGGFMRTITRIEVADVSMRFDGDGEGISEDTLYYILVCTAYVGIKIKTSFFFAKPCPY